MIIEIPDKATNGEVLKAVFDCDVTELKTMTSSAGEITVGYEVFLYNHRPKKEGEFGFGTKQKFDGDMWWNAPYTERREQMKIAWHTENPPKEEDDYLVTYSNGVMDICKWTDANYFGGNNFKTNWHWICKQYCEVVAWLPLPEPYKKGENK